MPLKFAALKRYGAIFLISMAGGIVGSVLLTATPLQAAIKNAQYGTVDVFNAQGNRIGTLAPGDSGQGVLFLFSEKGKTTVQMGSYPAGGESGQALIGLSDPLNQLRMLFRLHSSDNSPTMIMKDRYGVDKIVMGLRGANQTPYLEYKADDGRTVDLFNP